MITADWLKEREIQYIKFQRRLTSSIVEPGVPPLYRMQQITRRHNVNDNRNSAIQVVWIPTCEQGLKTQ